MTPQAETRLCLTLLFITFLVLKLTHVVHWSWWLVTAPLWGPVALALVFGLIAAVTFSRK